MKAAGRCSECKRPVAPNKVRCQRCLDMAAARAQKIVRRRMAQGKCRYCDSMATHGSMCDNHWQQRTHRRRLRVANGLCAQCNNRAVPGGKRCQKHIDMMAVSDRKRRVMRKARKLCIYCAQPVEGRSICLKCAEHRKTSTYSAKRYAYWQEQGWCSSCGNPETGGYRTCADCRARAREAVANAVAKGLCSNCRKRKVHGDYRTCLYCRQKRKESYIEKGHK